MFVITADQIDSRRRDDAVAAALERLIDAHSPGLPLPPERTAGDELQLATPRAETALGIVLDLARAGDWSVGVGCGSAQLGAGIRESSGPAFIAARRAVERAKRTPTRVAVETEPASVAAADAGALLDLLLLLRARRTDEGWELHDLLDRGTTQADAAAALGISPQAASDRAIAAGLRQDRAATEALARLLARLDESSEPDR